MERRNPDLKTTFKDFCGAAFGMASAALGMACAAAFAFDGSSTAASTGVPHSVQNLESPKRVPQEEQEAGVGCTRASVIPRLRRRIYSSINS